jgi:hypothetical protein
MKPALATVLLLARVAPALSAQEPGRAGQPYEHDRDAPVVAAVRASGPIRVDGVLDEATWAGAHPITRFVQLDPAEGEPATERTEVRMVYDDEALYVGAHLHDSDPVTTRLGRRDMPPAASDWLTVILDSYHDHRTAYGFEVNPSGVRRDQARAGGRGDDSWDPVWVARTSVAGSGWVAEMRIPFSQLRFSSASVQTWGIQVERTRARNQELAVWAFTPREQPGGIPRFGHLTGLREVPTGKRLEVLPYTVTRADYVDRSGNPFRSHEEYGWGVGGDLKYRVTSGLTLDATVNPDFGQVEVDPAVVNLSAFETYFPEKRPFFVEGAEIFRFGDDDLFYTRRIGRRPTLTPPHAARDVPEATRILGAAKLSGRTGNGWSVGVLDAVTAREVARFRTAAGESGEMVAEPLTNYFVGRVRRDSRRGQSTVGGFLGAVNRRLETEELTAVHRSAAYSGGIDFFHQWGERTWTLDGFLAVSHVRGESEPIAAAQRAPYRYFDRPDAGHLAFDSSRTSLGGFSGEISLSRQAGRHWRGRASLASVSPGHEVSDLGFQQRADRIDVSGEVSYSETRPGRVFRRYTLWIDPAVEYNYAGENVSTRLFAGSSFQLLNYWNGFLGAGVSLPGTVDDRLTRGGPAARQPGQWWTSSRVGSDPRGPLVVSAGAGYNRSGAGGSSLRVNADLLVKPEPNWQLSIGPSLQRRHDLAHYLLTVPDATATRTWGNRYVFAALDQTTLALEGRLSYTFTPGLSLQAFVQPLLASGAFGAPREFAEPGGFEFLVYGRDVGEVVEGIIYPGGRHPGATSFPVPRRDFNRRSLRGNAVLRWEWRPGSTLYVAWQHARRDFQPIGDFDLGRDAGALLAARPDNVFLVKVSYWLNP